MSINFDTNLLQNLQTIGLSEKEAIVYTGLIQEDEVSAITLSRVTGLHRQFVYTALEVLKEKGLVTQTTQRPAKWRAQSPRKLIAAVEEQQLHASRAVEQLLALQQNKSAQEFEVTEGLAAFRARFLESIRRAPENSSVELICGEWDKYFERVGDTHAMWDSIRIAKKIKLRTIGPDSLKTFMQRSKIKDFSTYRVLPNLKQNLVNTVIYEEEVVNEIYGTPHITFCIKNPEVAKSQRDFFETLWNIAIDVEFRKEI